MTTKAKRARMELARANFRQIKRSHASTRPTAQSDYDRLRQANMASKAAFLQSLGIDQTVDALQSIVARKPRVWKKREPLPPDQIRRSSRLQLRGRGSAQADTLRAQEQQQDTRPKVQVVRPKQPRCQPAASVGDRKWTIIDEHLDVEELTDAETEGESSEDDYAYESQSDSDWEPE